MSGQDKPNDYSKPTPIDASGGDVIPALENIPLIDAIQQAQGGGADAAKRYMTRVVQQAKTASEAQKRPLTQGEAIKAIIDGLANPDMKNTSERAR